MTEAKLYSYPDDYEGPEDTIKDKAEDIQQVIEERVSEYRAKFRVSEKEARCAVVSTLVDQEVRQHLYDHPHRTYEEALEIVLENDVPLKLQYICKGDPDMMKKYAIREQKALNASHEVDERVKQLMSEDSGIDYVGAVKKVLQEDKDLARRYGRFEI